MKNRKVLLSDFTFKFTGHGHYLVTYESPLTGKQWSRTINEMQIIDKTKNAESPKQIDLYNLMRTVKNNY